VGYWNSSADARDLFTCRIANVPTVVSTKKSTKNNNNNNDKYNDNDKDIRMKIK